MKRYPFMTGVALYYASSLQRLFFGYRRCPWLTINGVIRGQYSPFIDQA